MSYASKITDALGYYPVSTDLVLLDEMAKSTIGILFLALIFDIIILLFVIISVLLIYSLLMISVEAKAFEIGVMRMVGLSNNSLIFMILMQAVMFVLPAIILGFIVSVPLLMFVYSVMFDENLGLSTDPTPNVGAVF